jgi:YVTN family beta-propeller protein
MSLVSLAPRRAEAQVSSFAVVTSNHPSQSVTLIPTTGGPTTVAGVATSSGIGATSPDGRTVYVATLAGITAIDVAEQMGHRDIALPSPPIDLAITPDGARLYVLDRTSDLKVVDVATGTVVATVPIGPDSLIIAITPDGSRAYVAGSTNPRGPGFVRVLAIPAHTVTTTIDIGYPIALEIAPNGRTAYVTSVTGADPNELTRIDVATNTVEARIPKANARWITFTPDSRFTYIGLDDEVSVNGVQVIDTTTGSLVTEIPGPADQALLALAAVPDAPRVFALFADDAGPTGRRVRSIDTTTQQWTTLALNVALQSRELLMTPSYVAPGTPLAIDSQADLTAAGFRSFVPFLDGSTLQVTADVSIPRHLSILAGNATITVQSSSNAVFTGNVVGEGRLTLTGPGTVTLTGRNRHVNGTHVTGGVLNLQGPLGFESVHTGPILVVGDSTLTGRGVTGPVGVAALSTISPGGGDPGSPTTDQFRPASLIMAANARLVVDINGPNIGESYDAIDVSANPSNRAVIQDATLVVRTNFTQLPARGTTYAIVRNATGTFAGLPDGAEIATSQVRMRIRYQPAGCGTPTVACTVNLEVVDAAPTVTAGLAGDQRTNRNRVFGPTAFTVGDDATAPANVMLTATSSSPAVVPNANIVFGGSGASRTVTITPAPDAEGVTTIAIRLTDERGLFTEQKLVLRVGLPANTAPTITGLRDRRINRNAVLGPIEFTVADDFLPASQLIVTARSNNQNVVPDAGIVLGHLGAVRTLLAAPRADATGTATIIISVSDGTLNIERFFELHVGLGTTIEPPTITGLSNQSISLNSVLGPIGFTVDDGDTAPTELMVTARSSNAALLPGANITIGGAGTLRTLTATPLPGQSGTTIITVEVADDSQSAAQSFTLTVTADATYLLAEGSTGVFFDMDILLANPNLEATPVTLRFLKEGGAVVTQDRLLPATSQTVIRVDEIAGLEGAAMSTVVTSPSGRPVIVERTMRWGASGYGSHTDKASSGAATHWYFAEGAQGFFSTYFLLVNPQTTANTARVTYLRGSEPPFVQEYALEPQSRKTIGASDHPELRDREFGAVIVFDQPGMAERAMYFGAQPLWVGGHASAGVVGPSTQWFLAEGATGTYFTTFVLLANPTDVDAHATVTYLPASGASVAVPVTIPAGRRVTYNIAEQDPSLRDAAVATRVESDQPLIVERAQYWPGTPDGWQEAHNSFGVNEAGARWGLAEGRVGGPSSDQTYILLANPGTTPAEVTMTFLRTGGTTIVKSFTVPATSRFNVGVNGPGSHVPELANESFGTIVESTQPIVVERSLYSNVDGVIWAAGTNATATRLP